MRKTLLLDFPKAITDTIMADVKNTGVLQGETALQICQQLSISIEALMLQLLPLAAEFSKAAISSFKVGAVVKGGLSNKQPAANLYLGANFEFAGQSLGLTIHAEQSAISNAWQQGESTISALAVSALPCGHCRQFLYEVAGSRSLTILVPNQAIHQQEDYLTLELSQLLPSAFGPLDLGMKEMLMSQNFTTNGLTLSKLAQEPLFELAFQAANRCYAPYTKNFAGCGIELSNGKLFAGSYAENAAYNPSLSPFSAAFSNMAMASGDTTEANISRVVLVEKVGRVSQKTVTQNQLTACSHSVELEYFNCTIE